MSNALAVVTLFLKEQCPDLYQSMRGNLHRNHVESLAVAKGLTYPRAPGQGLLLGAPSMNCSQVAMRLVGCPKEGASDNYKERTRRSGSGCHIDRMDPCSPLGFATVYICFVDETNEKYSKEKRALKYSDLLVFQRQNGGRGVQIKTMQVGYICVVFHHSSLHLHGSVFPPKGKAEKLRAGEPDHSM